MGYGPNGVDVINPSDPSDIITCWIQPTSYPNLVAYNNDPVKQPYLEFYIMQACAAVNRMCNRKFNLQQMDQIFLNEHLWVRDYKAYSLQNRPLISVDGVWIQVVDKWTQVVQQYFQVSPNEGIVKVLPVLNPYVQVTIPSYVWGASTNLWFRFTSGYHVDYSTGVAINDVPAPVQMATAMYVDYLYNMSNTAGGVSSFRTQTYSETRVGGEDDPLIKSIKMILQPYLIRLAL